MSNYTKGGWSRNIKPASKYPIIFAGRNTHIAQVITKGLPEEEAEANCNLLAAAPELLTALKTTLNWIENIPAKCKVEGGLAIYSTIKDAIEKAEGK